jgi:hypothetical protein
MWEKRRIDTIKMNLLEIRLVGSGWIGLAQDRASWRALVNAVMNRRIPYNAEKLAIQPVACRVVLSSTELVSYRSCISNNVQRIAFIGRHS